MYVLVHAVFRCHWLLLPHTSWWILLMFWMQRRHLYPCPCSISFEIQYLYFLSLSDDTGQWYEIGCVYCLPFSLLGVNGHLCNVCPIGSKQHSRLENCIRLIVSLQYTTFPPHYVTFADIKYGSGKLRYIFQILALLQLVHTGSLSSKMFLYIVLVLHAMLPFSLAGGCQCCEGRLLSSAGLGRHCEEEGSMFAVLCYPPTSFSLSVIGRT